jgi:hypothetical protein
VRVALLLLLAAAPPAEAAPACRRGAAVVYQAQLVGTRVIACFERGGPRACFALDIAKPGATWTALPATAIPAIGPCGAMQCPPVRGPVTATVKVELCAPDGAACRTIVTPPEIAGELASSTSADGAYLAITSEQEVFVIDTARRQLASRIRPWQTPANGLGWRFHATRIAGDAVFVELIDGGQGIARLHEPSGALRDRIANDAPLDLALPVELAGELAVATRGGESLAFASTTRDPRTRTAPRTAPLFGPDGADARRDLALLAVTPDRKSIVAVRGETIGAIALHDLATGTTVVVPGVPSCP